MPSRSKYEQIEGETFTSQSSPKNPRTVRFQLEEPEEPERPTGWRLPLYYVVGVLTRLRDSCLAICSCEQVEAEY